MESMPLANVNKLNARLMAIWDEHLGKSESELHPVYFRPFTTNSLTFVGMNPSFNINGIATTVKDTEFENLELDNYFLTSNNSFSIDVSNQIAELSEEKYPTFFKQHVLLSERLKVSHWNHFDLFQYRQTNQKDFLQKVENRDGKLNNFGRDQFNLFLDALKLSSPKILLLANARAAKIFKANTQMTFSSEIGTYLVNLDGKQVPVFLSGMLTGGRALDVFSRERLFWHVERVYKAQQTPTS